MPRNLVMIKVPKTEVTKAGIALPKDVIDNQPIMNNAGVVAVTGPDCKELKVGDLAYFKMGMGNMISDEAMPQDAHYVIISEVDCIAYFSKSELISREKMN